MSVTEKNNTPINRPRRRHFFYIYASFIYLFFKFTRIPPNDIRGYSGFTQNRSSQPKRKHKTLAYTYKHINIYISYMYCIKINIKTKKTK